MITIDPKDFEAEVFRALRAERARVIPVIKSEINRLITSSPTYNSLVNGELKDLFCLDDQAKFIPKWVENQVDILPNNSTLLRFLDESYGDLFSRPWSS